MFGSAVKLDDDLVRRCRRYAEEAGYSSVEEFITHVLERELKARLGTEAEDQEEIARRLKGLGYID
jgi:predicted transcriptional regulator